MVLSIQVLIPMNCFEISIYLSSCGQFLSNPQEQINQTVLGSSCQWPYNLLNKVFSLNTGQTCLHMMAFQLENLFYKQGSGLTFTELLGFYSNCQFLAWILKIIYICMRLGISSLIGKFQAHGCPANQHGIGGPTYYVEISKCLFT